MAKDPAPSAVVTTVFAATGGVAFALSLLVFLWQYADAYGRPAGTWSWPGALNPIAANLALFAVFGAHHSLFARTRLKRLIESAVSPRLERTVYVWISSLLFAAVVLLWQPVPGRLWLVPDGIAPLLVGVQLSGVLLSLLAARRIDIFDLAGLRQAGVVEPRQAGQPSDRGVYGLVRHPIYLAWLLVVWPAASMTGTRFAFAACSTAYLVAAIPLEERDLRRTFGDAYGEYARRVRWRLLPFVY